MQSQSIDLLMQQAVQKDPGFDRDWFSVALNRSASFPDEIERWPVKMLVPFEPVKAKSDFKQLAIKIIEAL
jgi:hypothetical protein